MKSDEKKALDMRLTSLLETELTINPKGSVKLSIDLEKRLLKWQESNRWNRNFTRTLSMLEIKEIRNYLMSVDFSSWPTSNNKRSSSRRESEHHIIWSVRIYGPERKLIFDHFLHDEQPDYFFSFCDAISHFCRQTFTVSD